MLTWPLASTALVVFTLALALAWFERSRPSARVVALVATMAALAVVGRIAFAPLPNVKPTTDLILLAGFAFGAVPGFAVGSTTALVSNLFFGQGLHTPWQMLAWGGVGLLGALTRRALGEDPGRVPLAAVCALAGLAFGAFMDLSLWATLGGSHTVAEYGAIALRSAPFNIAHAVGNLVFALAFAPLLLRALGRARQRATVVIRPLAPGAGPGARPVGGIGAPAAAGVLAVVVAASALLVTPAPARAAAPTPLSYLLDHQVSGGGFGETSSAAALDSGWAAMALGASGGTAKAQSRAKTYLAKAATGSTDPGDLERFILGLRALGAPARDAKGRDLTAALLTQQAADGSFAGLVNQTAFGVLALRAAGRSRSSKPVTAAARYLLEKPGEDGGFNFSGRGASGVDDTAGVIQALVAAGHRNHRVTKQALAFLRGRQGEDGGFPIGTQTQSNAMSTAWGIQAMLAMGQNPVKLRSGGRSPVAFLRSLADADGHIRYSRTSDQTPVWVTAQAQLALVGSSLPVRHVAPARRARAAAAVAVTPPVRAAAKRKARSTLRAVARARQVEAVVDQLQQSPAMAPAIASAVIVAALLRLA